MIKYVEFRKTPQSFLFKENENSNVIELKFEDILSVEVFDKVKYVKKTFKLSKHSKDFDFLDDKQSFDLQEETKFIEELVGGKFKLYYLSDTGVNHFFYSKDSLNTVLPLLYKMYNNFESKVVENDEYKRELYLNVFCENNILLKNEVNKLKYKETELIDYFIKTNECVSGIKVKRKERDFSFFKLSVTSDVNFISFKEFNVDFSKSTLINFGGEFEYVLPYYNNLFSFEFLPSISFYKDKVVYNNPIPIYQVDNVNYYDPDNGKTLHFESTTFSIPVNLKIYPINKKVKVYTSLTLFNIFSAGKGKVNFDNEPSFDSRWIPPFYGFFEIGGEYKNFGVSFKKLRKFESSTQYFNGYAISLKYNVFSSKKQKKQ